MVNSIKLGASQVALEVKNMTANAGDIRDLGSILGWEVSLEKEMATHSCLEKSHGQRSLAGYSIGSERVRHG